MKPLLNLKVPIAEDDNDRKLLSDIEKYDVHIVGVQAEKNSPQFAFTIGLYYHYLHPEVVIFGLGHEKCKTLLNEISNLIKNGTKIKDRDLRDDILQKYSVSFRSVMLDKYKEHLGYGIWFYRNLKRPFPCLQCIWPDAEGIFPWQNGYDSKFSALQTCLFDSHA